MHYLHVQEPWLGYIKSGVKKVEGRKNKPKYACWGPGDRVKFYNEGDSVVVTLVKLITYPSIAEYLQHEGLKNTLPGISSIQEGLSIYEQWNTPEEIQELGFLAIHVSL